MKYNFLPNVEGHEINPIIDNHAKSGWKVHSIIPKYGDSSRYAILFFKEG